MSTGPLVSIGVEDFHKSVQKALVAAFPSCRVDLVVPGVSHQPKTRGGHAGHAGPTISDWAVRLHQVQHSFQAQPSHDINPAIKSGRGKVRAKSQHGEYSGPRRVVMIKQCKRLLLIR